MSGQQGDFNTMAGQQGGYEDVSDQQGYPDASGHQASCGSGSVSNVDSSNSNNDSGYGNSTNSGPTGSTGRTGLQAQGQGFGSGFDQGFGQGLSGGPDGSEPHAGVHVQEQVTPDSASRDTDMVSPQMPLMQSKLFKDKLSTLVACIEQQQSCIVFECKPDNANVPLQHTTGSKPGGGYETHQHHRDSFTTKSYVQGS